MKKIILLAAALIVCGLSTGCTTTAVTTNPDGTTATNKVPDRAKTEQVKAVVTGVTTFALTESLAQFPKEADKIEVYARAAGGIFCEMQRTKEFDPIVLEKALYAIAPHIEDEETRRYLTTARNALLTTYQVAYGQRFNAELDPDKWQAFVCDVFCDAINRGLIDSGRKGVK